MNLRRLVGRVVAPPLIAGILALHLDGCAETVPPGPRTVDLRADAEGRFYFIAPGSEIEITRRDGVLLRGRLLGTQRMSDEEYAAHRSARASALRGDSLPAAGDSIEILPRRGTPWSAQLAGFSLGGVEVRRDTSVQVLAFFDLDEVRAGGWTRKGPQLAWEAIAGRLPLTTLIRVGVAAGEVSVPADEVGEVRAPAAPVSGAGSHVGTGVAIVAGVLVAAVLGAMLAIYIIVHSMDQSCGSMQSIGWSPLLDPADLPRELAGPAPMPDRRLLASEVRP